MAKTKKFLRSKEREILRIIHKKGGSMTPNELAQETGFSYITIKKYLKRLLDAGIIQEV